MMPGGMDLTPATVAAFVLFIGILIFVHELGHFLAAKYFGIKVLKFSLGFGPPIFRFEQGETTYQIALLPLGGFVKMLGESPVDEIPPEDRHRAFHSVPVYQRAIVAFAGPLFNLVFPVICFFAYYLLGPTVISPIVGQVSPGSPAAHAGLLSGDRIVEVDGEPVWGFERLQELVGARAEIATRFEILRGAETLSLTITPMESPDRDLFGGAKTRGLLGISTARIGDTRVGVDGPPGTGFGLVTGDKLLSIDGVALATLADADRAIAERAGRRVEVVVSRPTAMAAGGLLAASFEAVQRISIEVPAGAAGLGALGLAPADTFLRELEPDGPAARAGLRKGDRLLEIQGEPVWAFYGFFEKLRAANDAPVKIKVRRAGEEREVELVADKKELTNEVTGKPEPYYDAGIGVGAIPRRAHTMHWGSDGRYITERAELPIGEALRSSVRQTAEITGAIAMAVFKLFTGGISIKTVGGPIMLFQVSALAAERGLFAYLELLALISVNLGIVNLLPLPVFDGGHLVFCAIEAIKRRPVSQRVREAAMMVGLLLIVALFVLVIANDLTRTFAE